MKALWLATAALSALPATAAFAQAPAQPPAAPAARPAPPASAPKPADPKPAYRGTRVEGVTVTAPGSEYRSSIDRRSYSVSGDLGATSGSIGDALRNIPSVDVDVQGNISLRGESNVTIMIDGKPSGMFKGEGRANALQQLPADQIDRVEVITNPSAAFKPDGSGGIINLVTKKGRGAGRTGSVRASFGDAGRYNGGVSFASNTRHWTLSGDAGARHDSQKSDSTDVRSRLNTATGQWIDSRRTSVSTNTGDTWNARAGVDYDPDAKTRYSAEFSGWGGRFASRNFDHYEGEDSAGVPNDVYDRTSGGVFRMRNTTAQGNYRRKFTGEEHELTIDVSQDHTSTKNEYTSLYARVSPQPNPFELGANRNIFDETEAKVEYKRPLPHEAKMVVGYELEIDNNDYDRLFARGPDRAGATVDPQLTSRFLFDQTINTVYGTYERRFGDFTALAGLRLEAVQIDVDQRTANVQAGNDYRDVYPSLHLGYQLSQSQQLTASYSRRVQRPNAQDLNPARVYVDPYNYRQGNPFLKPQQTDSYELGWQYRRQQTYYTATAFWRQSRNGVTDVVQDLGGGILLTTRENLGESRRGGLELVANSRFGRKLNLSVNSTVYWNEIDAANLGFTNKRSAFAIDGRANLTWTVNSTDILQVQARGSGKRLTPQGYTKPSGMLNLGYRHKFNDRVTGTIQAQDVLNTFKMRQVIDTPILKDRTERNFSQRGVFVSLTYSLGRPNNRRQRDQGIEFDNGPSMGPQ